MGFYRNTELVNKVNNIITSGELSDESKNTITTLLRNYNDLTYGNGDNPNEFKVTAIDRLINDCSLDEEYVAMKLSQTHPTLQQNFMRICREFIKKMAEKTYFDGRNESSVNLAKRLNEVMESDASLPFI